MSATAELLSAAPDLGLADTRFAGDLAEAVIAARAERHLTAGALKDASGLSARTLRDIETGNPHRRYSPNTLASLDEALDWEQGRAWSILHGRGPGLTRGESEAITNALHVLERRLDELLERPPWLVDLGLVLRSLTPEERRFVLEVAYSTAGTTPEDRRAVLDVLARLRHRV